MWHQHMLFLPQICSQYCNYVCVCTKVDSYASCSFGKLRFSSIFLSRGATATSAEIRTMGHPITMRSFDLPSLIRGAIDGGLKESFAVF